MWISSFCWFEIGMCGYLQTLLKSYYWDFRYTYPRFLWKTKKAEIHQDILLSSMSYLYGWFWL